MSALAFDPRAYLDRLHRPQPQPMPPPRTAGNVVSLLEAVEARREALVGIIAAARAEEGGRVDDWPESGEGNGNG